MKKICFVVGSLQKGGAERVVVTLSNTFARRGIAVTIFCIGKRAETVAYTLEPDVKVHNIQFGSTGLLLRKWKQLMELRGEISVISPDVVISFMDYINIQMLVALFGINIPKVVSIRANPKNTNRLFIIAQKILYHCAAGCVFQTSEQQRFFPSKKRKDIIIPNPVISEALKVEYTPTEESIVTVGRLNANKNHKLLFRAFGAIAKEYPKLQLAIYGEGEERNSLEAFARELGLCDRIFLPGVVDDIVFRIAKAKLFVYTSNLEGMPNALIEAMCIGLPCISTRFRGGAAGMLIQDGVNGILVPCDDYEALEAAIKRLLTDNELRIKLGESAKNLRDRVNPEKIADIWLDFLENVQK